MSEAIDDVCAFTRLTDGVFEYIKLSTDEPGLAKVNLWSIIILMFLLTCNMHILVRPGAF